MKIKSKSLYLDVGKLEINSIDVNSGIFISTNSIIANGWSSHSKSNQGIGQIRDSHLSRCFSIIKDDDVIDAPINDNAYFYTVNKQENTCGSEINLTDININGLETNASVCVGDTDQMGWSSHSKTNIGEGHNKGINTSQENISIIYDEDFIDAPIKVEKIIATNDK